MYVKIYVLISKNTDGVEIYIFAQGNLLNFVINNKVSTKIFNGNPNIWVKLIEIKDKLIRSIPIITPIIIIIMVNMLITTLFILHHTLFLRTKTN